VIGLDIAERRWLALIADQGAFAVFLAVGKLLARHILARDFIGSDGGRHIIDKAGADFQALLGGIIIDRRAESSGQFCKRLLSVL
jgi:hypothetical protein